MKQIIFLLLLSISTSINAQSGIANINAKEFKTLISKNDGIILDTRTTSEFSSGHIEGATLINLQSSNVESVLLALPKNKPLYLYCYSGSRSIMVAKYLVQKGYTKIFNMQCGIIDWKNNDFALVTKSNAPKAPQPDGVSPDVYKKVTASGLVLVDFYATWCAPCKQMMPMLDKIKTEYAGKLTLLKVNHDASKELAKIANVQTVPYLVLFKNGKIVFTKSGSITEAELKKLINANLK